MCVAHFNNKSLIVLINLHTYEQILTYFSDPSWAQPSSGPYCIIVDINVSLSFNGKYSEILDFDWLWSNVAKVVAIDVNVCATRPRLFGHLK